MKQNEQIWIEAISNTVSFASNMVDKANSEKHVNNIITLSGQSTDYSIIDKQIELIYNAKDIEIENKNKMVTDLLLLKEKLRDKVLERKKRCSEMIDNHMDKTFAFIGKIVLGIGTGGLTFLPDCWRGIKGMFDNTKELTIYNHYPID